jgi:hypothetical protein
LGIPRQKSSRHGLARVHENYAAVFVTADVVSFA